MLEVYTDGSCLINGSFGPGGWACVFVRNGREIHQVSGRMSRSTNNQAEWLAVTRALRVIEDEKMLGSSLYDYTSNELIRVISDSQLVVRQMRGDYRVKDPFLRSLWKDCHEIIDNNSLRVEWIWVRGHNGNKFNERADELARAQARSMQMNKEMRNGYNFGLRD